MLSIHGFPVGPLQANCYIVENPATKEAVVVDPGDEATEILGVVARLGVHISAIWNTHGHIDHINGNAGVQARTGAQISIHENAAAMLQSPLLSGAQWVGVPFHPSKADRTWKGGERFSALGHEWRIIHAPGHSQGCCLIVCDAEDLVLGGDVLFQGAIGRTDLPGGDPVVMTETLRKLFNEWGKDTWRIYPGHGPETTIGAERRSNDLVRMALERGLE